MIVALLVPSKLAAPQNPKAERHLRLITSERDRTAVGAPQNPKAERHLRRAEGPIVDSMRLLIAPQNPKAERHLRLV